MPMCFRVSTTVTTSPPAVFDTDHAPSKQMETRITNYPNQQLQNGIAKNQASATRFKKAVRVLKRIENAMVEDSADR